jgi:ABC-2 type transport system ATP-binding protein
MATPELAVVRAHGGADRGTAVGLACRLHQRLGALAEARVVTGELAIETREVTMRFPRQQGWKSLFRSEPGKVALDRVSVDVARGEIFGLLGPNGAGKTTLVKVLSTLTIPTSGQATVAGLDVVRDSIGVRRRLGVVYGDERTFYWRISALENLLFYAALYGVPRAEARQRSLDVLDLVGLGHAAHMRMHHYSSGMKQRASIARGLLNDPEILIMDEPTRALDPMAALELRRLVRERVVSERRTVLIATNIMAEAEALCDRVAFINGGQVQMTGEIGELRAVLQADEVHHVVAGGMTYVSIEALRALPGIESLKAVPLANDQYRLEVTTKREAAAVPALVRRIVEGGGDVWSCGKRELTLEEMFTTLVERGHREGTRERVRA